MPPNFTQPRLHNPNHRQGIHINDAGFLVQKKPPPRGWRKSMENASIIQGMIEHEFIVSFMARRDQSIFINSDQTESFDLICLN